MIESAVIHDTFAFERSFLASPSRVFAAFATAEARKIWFCGSEATAKYEVDFRVGGRERLRFNHDDTAMRYDAQYYDISIDQLIIYFLRDV